MAQFDIEALNSEIAEFKEKYKNTDLKTPEELNAYISDTDKILEKYPDPEGEAREILGDFCSLRGCWVVVFGNDLEHGIPYYHKSIELCPDSFDMHWGYYTTLEEIVEDEDLATPELIQDAIDCLQFCIDYCDTPELKEEHHVNLRYLDLARVYLAAKQPEKAIECADKSLEIQDDGYAREIMARAYVEQGKIHLAADQNEKAVECAQMSLIVLKNDDAIELLRNAKKRQGFFGRLFARFKKR